ncbi:MSC_0882 family membrane protein [Spiroplasma endosymbiont of Panorpa germanica]|uniref:MSC_0882 family membrane protein n=1 Tax=Spiroplasma endosymbiont of Panorpa germanica TaxID=3066314 RepID=UPI0030CD83BB
MGYNNDFKNNGYNNQNNNFDPNYGNQNRNVIQPRRYDQRSANSFNDDLPFIDDTSEYQKSVIKNNQSSAQIEYQKKLQRYSQYRLENENNYQNNWNQGNYNYPQNYYQETMDFEKPISYGNYDFNPYEPINNNLNYYNQSGYYQSLAPVQVPRQTNYSQEALNHQNNGSCDVPGCEFNQSESFSKPNSSQPNPAPLGNNQNYNPGGNMPNFAPDYSWNNQFDKKEKLEYSKQYSKSQIIPKQILKEIFLEKTRVALLIIFGLVGLITTSIFTAAYFEAKRMGLSLSDPNQKIWGIPTVNIPYPFWMISIMIISLSLFLIGLADLLFLNANVKKYEKDLRLGYENVPYFITKNYRAIVARAVYLNWIAFTSYVLMSIVLGILYGMQTAFESGKTDIYLFFWKVGNFKNFTSEITVTITCLLTVLGIHIANIVFTKIRKNNLISYYGYEILPPDEIRAIKRGANKRCMIIFFVTLFTILFVIVIPIIIIKKKKGVPFRWPWQMLN